MSLYYEAAKVLEDIADGSKSLKQRVYNDKTLKSSPGAVFALVSEAAKWSEILSDVVENSGILKVERKLTPALSLVLSHDLLLSKKGLSASRNHHLVDVISKHKARLTSELTRTRIKKGVASIDQLRAQLGSDNINGYDASDDASKTFHPRWIRINAVKTTLEDCLGSTFEDYKKLSSLTALQNHGKLGIYLDENIPDLVAVHPSVDLTKSQSYRDGHIILQDKASCFPAYLLDPQSGPGTIIDGCAAPGNKTTHLAAIISKQLPTKARIIACERAKDRAQTLKNMVHRAGADDLVTILAEQDFLVLDPTATKHADVTSILLDPSCSGSGIVGRDAKSASRPVVLPSPSSSTPTLNPKKRKRPASKPTPCPPPAIEEEQEQEQEQPDLSTSDDDKEKLAARLRALSSFQSKMVQHAMRFPSATRVSYSTCSIHGAENERVAARVLESDVAREGGWRVLRREEQVSGLRKWDRRGDLEECRSAVGDEEKARVLAEACIRAAKGTGEGTMGFFIVAFVRDSVHMEEKEGEADADEWDGFGD
ncbi:hypothetical protein ANO11243_088160 [Dothideomycetidae sp. 11243]|nr:hypothetical protein ANO11243_088160 [fungal sp. No.11243]